MERLILNYTATGQHELQLNDASEFSTFTDDNIRLIIDCTTQEPIVTPLDRTALSSVSYDSTTQKLTITLTSSSSPLTVNGEVSVKIDDGNSTAKQGTNTSATNTAIYEKVNDIAALDSDLLAGKQQLATQISAKGIPSVSTDALTAMATKVGQIQQTVNTGTSDFDEMLMPSDCEFNVYKIATDLMKTTLPSYFPSYLQSYRAGYGANAHFVGEYYRGYDTLELTGADGYLTNEGDFYTISAELTRTNEDDEEETYHTVTHTKPDGTTETWEADTITHTWHDNSNGMVNRYVAFFYLATAWSFTNTTASICPRRAALCGTCNSFVIATENRLTDLWVIGTLGHFEGGTTGSTWNPAQVIQHYTTHSSGNCYTKLTNGVSVILPDLEEIIGNAVLLSYYNSKATIISLPKLKTCTGYICYYSGNFDNGNYITGFNIGEVYLDAIEKVTHILFYLYTDHYHEYLFNGFTGLHCASLKEITTYIIYSIIANSYGSCLSTLKVIDLPALEKISGGGILYAYQSYSYGDMLQALTKIYTPSLTYISGNFMTLSSGNQDVKFQNLIDVEVGALTTSFKFNKWNPTTVIADATKLTTLNSNIRNHIAAKVSDRTGLSALTFTVSSNLYSNLEQATIDAFTAKNWTVAGV